MTATLRPCFWASSKARPMRVMEDEKQEKKSFFEVWAKISSRRGRTARSLGVQPLAVDVGRVLEEGEHAAGFAELGEGLEVEGLAVRWGEVDFEVAGVQHDADGRVDGERDAIDERMRDADGHDREGPEGEALAGSISMRSASSRRRCSSSFPSTRARVNSVP